MEAENKASLRILNRLSVRIKKPNLRMRTAGAQTSHRALGDLRMIDERQAAHPGKSGSQRKQSRYQ